jgi:hypothetical protein
MTTAEFEERLARLEKRSGWLKRVTVVSLTLAGVAFLTGPGRALLPDPLHVNRTLEAESFTLVDENGKTRGTLSIEKDRPMLKLYDPSAKELVVLGGAANGRGELAGGLWLSDSHHRELVSLQSILPGLAIDDPNGKTEVSLVADAESPHLSLSDSQGNVRAQLGVSGERATFTLSGSNRNAEVELEVARLGRTAKESFPGQEYKESLTLTDEHLTRRVLLGSFSTGQGLVLTDAEGRQTYAVGSKK